jgi:Flp pilus assembly protein TadB
MKGKYKNTNNTLTINYTIEPNSKFGLLYLKFFPVFALFGINLFFLLVLKKAPIEIYISFNLFVIFMIFFSRWDLKRRKKNMERKFIEIFEIIQ